MRYMMLLLLFLGGCATLNTQQVDKIRSDCLNAKGIFHISFVDYINRWAPNKMECWYGVDEAQLKSLQMLNKQP